jgi:hypothetical protein
MRERHSTRKGEKRRQRYSEARLRAHRDRNNRKKRRLLLVDGHRELESVNGNAGDAPTQLLASADYELQTLVKEVRKSREEKAEIQ